MNKQSASTALEESPSSRAAASPHNELLMRFPLSGQLISISPDMRFQRTGIFINMHSKQVDERTAGKRDLNQGCKTTRKTRKNTPSHNKPCELKCKSKKGNGRTTAPPLLLEIYGRQIFSIIV